MTLTDKLNHPLILLADRIAAEIHPQGFRTSSTTPEMPHPRRLARLVATLDGVNEINLAVAVLHDVLEDSSLTASALTDMLLAGGSDPDSVAKVVALVQELTKPYSTASGLREGEKRLKFAEKLQGISGRAMRIKLADRLDSIINGEAMPLGMLSIYLAESEMVVEACGHVDPPLAGWLLHEINKRRNPGPKEA